MKAFIFDMDGVIIDSEPINTGLAIKTVAHFGKSITSNEMEKYAGSTMKVIFSSIKENKQINAPLEEIITYMQASMLRNLIETEIEPIKGIRQLLSNLKTNNIPTAIASSSPKHIIEAVVDKFKLADYFAHLVSGNEVKHSKPDPEIYLVTAEKLGVLPNECVVLEDSTNGVNAAKNAGMTCIGFRNLNSGNQDISRADLIVDTIGKIDLNKI
ncbi:HAD family hydrolase [Anaerosinus massiliensis]|uniref:HAD family hydrolase n=1 Tax=Massilibacillus massiliensis TaxID=1806837 RepID=UPI000DA61C76|nr:HAD family phosphatase [Massilibacillus massiliensis]